MVMIFTLVTAVQEKLNEIIDQMKIRREEEKKRKEREAEEAEKVKQTNTQYCSRDFYCLCLKGNLKLGWCQLYILTKHCSTAVIFTETSHTLHKGAHVG